MPASEDDLHRTFFAARSPPTNGCELERKVKCDHGSMACMPAVFMQCNRAPPTETCDMSPASLLEFEAITEILRTE